MIPPIQQQPKQESWTSLVLVICIAIISIQYMDLQRLREYNRRLEDENRELRGGRVGLVRLIDDLRQLFTDNGISVRK